MKRFLVFACETCYPTGGPGDFMRSFDTEHAAEIDALRKALDAATLERHAPGCEIAAALAKAEGKQ